MAGKNNAKAGDAKEAQPHWHDQPEFKDLAQTWGRKMITVHEKKMYP
jgi:hypothetical protein